MGMDVCGKKPVNEVGEYFRNNVWWWHPLWDYCQEVAPKLTGKVKHGHTNDGDGLGKRDATALSKVLKREIESGRTKEYEVAYKKAMAEMPDEPCTICGGTGKRAEPPNTGPGEMECNACRGKGSTRPWATAYPFSEENVIHFAAFLEGSGGFSIC
jgi:hypothetical protein